MRPGEGTRKRGGTVKGTRVDRVPYLRVGRYKWVCCCSTAMLLALLRVAVAVHRSREKEKEKERFGKVL